MGDIFLSLCKVAIRYETALYTKAIHHAKRLKHLKLHIEHEGRRGLIELPFACFTRSMERYVDTGR
jgi:hypothetical protein